MWSDTLSRKVRDYQLKMAEQGVNNGQQSVNIAREKSISIPDMSAIPKMFKFGIRVETCLVLLITLCEIVATAVILALAKSEKPNTPLRPWIMGYLSVCAAFLPVIYMDYRVKKGILDSIVHESGDEDGSGSSDRFDCFDIILR